MDLSAFGVDFSKYVKLRVESDSGKAKIFINDKLAYVTFGPPTYHPLKDYRDRLPLPGNRIGGLCKALAMEK